MLFYCYNVSTDFHSVTVDQFLLYVVLCEWNSIFIVFLFGVLIQYICFDFYPAICFYHHFIPDYWWVILQHVAIAGHFSCLCFINIMSNHLWTLGLRFLGNFQSVFKYRFFWSLFAFRWHNRSLMVSHCCLHCIL